MEPGALMGGDLAAPGWIWPLWYLKNKLYGIRLMQV